MKPDPVQYTNGGIQITIPTPCPAALHEQLLKGITASFKNHLLNPVETTQEAQDIASLADIQLALLPTELQLKKAFQ